MSAFPAMVRRVIPGHGGLALRNGIDLEPAWRLEAPALCGSGLNGDDREMPVRNLVVGRPRRART